MNVYLSFLYNLYSQRREKEDAHIQWHMHTHTHTHIHTHAHTYTHSVLRGIRSGCLPTTICTDGQAWLYVKALYYHPWHYFHTLWQFSPRMKEKKNVLQFYSSRSSRSHSLDFSSADIQNCTHTHIHTQTHTHTRTLFDHCDDLKMHEPERPEVKSLWPSTAGVEVMWRRNNWGENTSDDNAYLTCKVSTMNAFGGNRCLHTDLCRWSDLVYYRS